VSEPAPVPAAPRRLRVAVIAVDPLRRAGLESIIRNAGHVLSDDTERTDVLLTDGVAPGSGPPTVMLGGSDSDALGVLPRDAAPEQIEAAIRAVAAG
jgi:hypothetical protein